MKKRIPKCDNVADEWHRDCSMKASYTCKVCGANFCKGCAGYEDYECPNHERPLLKKIRVK